MIYRYTISGLSLNLSQWLEIRASIRESVNELSDASNPAEKKQITTEKAIIKAIVPKIGKKLGVKTEKILDATLIKESIDARKKSDIKFTYTVDFSSKEPIKKAQIAPDRYYDGVAFGNKKIEGRPVVVGFGPCGMMAALLLAERGLKPVIVERGKAVDQRSIDVENFWNNRVLDPESNVQFGAGGAGTFSDGKLTTGIKDRRIRKVLEDFVSMGAPREILYKGKPHIGTDVLKTVVKNLEDKIIALGGTFLYSTKFEKLIIENDSLVGIQITKKSSEMTTLNTSDVILAIGHSARDTFENLYEQGVSMEQKPFSMGVRIEHPQEIIDIAQYGITGVLPAADYKLNHKCENGRGVYTFCMCPGGEVIMAASCRNTVVTNGMSNSKRDSGIANSGLLCDLKTSDFMSNHPLAGMYFQEKYEKLAFEKGGKNYMPPRCTWKQLRDGDEESVGIYESLPDFVIQSIKEAMPYLGKKLNGFDMDDALLTGVETRSSSPVRFNRDNRFLGQINENGHCEFIEGFYPCGEGAGYAGGIMSAACDGIRAAEQIIMKYEAPNFEG